MITLSFTEQEQLCNASFARLGKVFHLCTPEDHPIIFKTIEDMQTCMSLIGLVSKLYPDIIILTFEVMTNHMHIVAAGEENSILSFFHDLRKLLKRNLNSDQGTIDLRKLEPALLEIKDINYLRNVIAYVNRNGYAVSPGDSPFSYEWGANRFYFNPEAKKRFAVARSPITQTACQQISHSRKFDHVSGLFTVDGYISPQCFCDIECGESMFRDARHYFSMTSKNIESQAEIARSVGEKAFYTDDDLYYLIQSIAKEKHGVSSPGLLPVDAKINLAKMMHFDYSASNKQISRLLKMDVTTTNALFPLSAKTK